MTSELLEAVEKVRIDADEGILGEECIDDVLHNQRPKKRTKRDREALKRELEKQFLTPPRSFGPEWLNRLQQYVAKIDA